MYHSFRLPPIGLLLTDQFAFRLTGSTTCAIISLLLDASLLLPYNRFVSLISLDFSNAFVTVSHHSLSSKLSIIELSDAIYDWSLSFLQNLSHATRYAGITSLLAYINANVFQGSGFGPSSYHNAASDLLVLGLRLAQSL